jgi:hypothetical protein
MLRCRVPRERRWPRSHRRQVLDRGTHTIPACSSQATVHPDIDHWRDKEREIVKYVRMMGVCAVSVIALVAVTSSVAWAKLPEWGKCEATATGTGGKYGDAACIVPVRKVYHNYPGGYEWAPLQGEEPTELEYTNEALKKGVLQPVSETSVTLAGGQKIACGPLIPETQIRFNGFHATGEAPLLAFQGCKDEQGKECHTTDGAFPGEIDTTTAWEHGKEHEEGSWTGTTTFVEGKGTSDPVVGIVYKTSGKRERFLQQLVCEESEIHAISVGGHKSGEELVVGITPVNRMSPSFTAGLRQSEGRQLPTALEGHATKPIEALVNAERWETIGVETTMLFPDMYIGHENPNFERHELELRATP